MFKGGLYSTLLTPEIINRIVTCSAFLVGFIDGGQLSHSACTLQVFIELLANVAYLHLHSQDQY
jgi:hypothetical protein